MTVPLNSILVFMSKFFQILFMTLETPLVIYRGAFKTCGKSKMELLWKSIILKAVHYFCKKLHFKCLVWFWIRLGYRFINCSLFTILRQITERFSWTVLKNIQNELGKWLRLLNPFLKCTKEVIITKDGQGIFTSN